MDLRICETLLEADDILYASGTCGNAGIAHFKSHFPRYGGYYHRTAGGASGAHLLPLYRVLGWKCPDFPDLQLLCEQDQHQRGQCHQGGYF